MARHDIADLKRLAARERELVTGCEVCGDSMGTAVAEMYDAALYARDGDAPMVYCHLSCGRTDGLEIA